MTPLLQLRGLTMTVSDALTAYIAVHDKILRETATLTSVLKNLFGRGIPASELLEMAEKLVPLWDSMHAQVEKFRIDHASYLRQEETAYLDILVRYVAAVRKTVGALVARQRLLYEASRGGPKNPMTLEALKQSEAEYQLSVDEYTAIGQELNASAPAVFS